jgi:hypothetical protein
MKKVLLIIIYAHFFTATLFSQQLSPSVVSATGNFMNNPSGMLSYTVGEMTAIETYESPSNILTQGFQQVWDFGTAIKEIPSNAFFEVFPNPSPGKFLITSSRVKEKILRLKIFDVNGKIIQTLSIFPTSDFFVHPVDLTFAPQGSYFITITMTGSDDEISHLFTRTIQIIQ